MSNITIRKRYIFLAVALVTTISILTGGLLATIFKAPTPVIALAIHSVSTDSKGAQPYLPGTGYKFVIVDLSIKNISRDTFALAPVRQTHLTDSQGNRYEMSPTTLDKPLIAGLMATDEQRTGKVSYTVPQSSSGLVFHFESSDPNYNYSRALDIK